MRTLISHVRANAIAYAALFVALGSGTALAAATIGPTDIKDNAVRSRHIKAQNVTSSDLKDDGVTGNDVDESTLQGVVPDARLPRAAFESSFSIESTLHFNVIDPTNLPGFQIQNDGDADDQSSVLVKNINAGGGADIHVSGAGSASTSTVTPGNSLEVQAPASDPNQLDLYVVSHAVTNQPLWVHCGFDQVDDLGACWGALTHNP